MSFVKCKSRFDENVYAFPGLSKCRTRYVATVATRNGAGAVGNFSQDFPPAVPEGFTPAPQTEKASGLGSRDSLARDTQKKLQSFK